MKLYWTGSFWTSILITNIKMGNNPTRLQAIILFRAETISTDIISEWPRCPACLFRHLVSSYVMISNVSVALISRQMKILTFWKPWRKYLYIRYIPLNHLHRVLVVFVIQCNHKILAILQGVPKKYLSGVFFNRYTWYFRTTLVQLVS